MPGYYDDLLSQNYPPLTAYSPLPSYYGAPIPETIGPSQMTSWQQFRGGNLGHKLLGPTPLEKSIGVAPGGDPGIVPTFLNSPLALAATPTMKMANYAQAMEQSMPRIGRQILYGSDRLGMAEAENIAGRIGGDIPVQKVQEAFKKFVTMQEMTPEEEAMVNRLARENPQLYERLEQAYPVKVPGVEPIPEGKVTSLGQLTVQQQKRMDAAKEKLIKAMKERWGETPPPEFFE